MRSKPGSRFVFTTGLTLVELLVAISILAVVAVLGWRGLDTLLRSRSTLASELEQVRAMQLAFAQLQRDCEQLANTASLTGRIVLVTGNGKLTLVRNVIIENQPLKLQVVSYRLTDGRLLRSESTATRNLHELDAQWRAAASETHNAIVLQSGLSAMTIRYWLRSASGWRVPASGEATFAASGSSMPGGLEITLQSEGKAATVKAMLLGAT